MNQFNGWKKGLWVMVLWPAVVLGGEGTRVGGFLRLGAGARGEAMGTAYTAVAKDATAIYWNPAGLAGVERRAATFMHATQIDDSYYDFAGYAQKAGGGGVGLGVQYYSAGSVPALDTEGTANGNLTPSDLSASLGYGREVMGVRWGVAGKYVQSKLDKSATTGAVDVGVMTKGWGDHLRLGATAVNLVGKLKFGTTAEALPVEYRVGGAWVAQGLTLAVDQAFPQGDKAYTSVGGEYHIGVGKDLSIALRAGYNGERAQEGAGSNGIAMGGGFGFGGATVDYALVTMGDLDATHRFSLGYKF